MSDKLKNILTTTECPSYDIFQKYLYEGLNRSERHAFEMHLNTCGFCQEALEGMQEAGNHEFVLSLNELNKSIDERVSRKFSFSRLSIAASLVLALTFGGVYLLQLSKVNNAEQLSVKTENLEEQNEDVSAPIEVPETTLEIEGDEVEEEEALLEEEYIVLELNDDIEQKKLAQNSSELFKSERSKPGKTASTKSKDNSVETSEENMVEATELISIDYEAEDTGYLDSDLAAGAASSTNVPMRTSGDDEAMELDEIIVTETKSSESSGIEVDYGRMLSFASEQFNSSFTRSESQSTKKKSMEKNDEIDSPTYSNSNRESIEVQINQVRQGQYQTSYNEINTLLPKDVWNPDELATLKWLKVICELNLNMSAKATLKELKRINNPYQDEAKKLYQQLY